MANIANTEDNLDTNPVEPTDSVEPSGSTNPTGTDKTENTSAVRSGSIDIILSNVYPPLSKQQYEILDNTLNDVKWAQPATIEEVKNFIVKDLAPELNKLFIEEVTKSIKSGSLKLNYEPTEVSDFINKRFDNYYLKDDLYTKTEIENKYVSKDDISENAHVTGNNLYNTENNSLSGSYTIPLISQSGYLNVPYLNAGIIQSYAQVSNDITPELSLIAYKNMGDSRIRFSDSDHFYDNYIKPLLKTFFENQYTKDHIDGEFVHKSEVAEEPTPLKIVKYNLHGDGSTLLKTHNLSVENKVELHNLKISDENYDILTINNNKIEKISSDNLKQKLSIPIQAADIKDVNKIETKLNNLQDTVNLLDKITSKKSEIYLKEETYSRDELQSLVDRIVKDSREQLAKSSGTLLGDIKIRFTKDDENMLKAGYLPCDGRTIATFTSGKVSDVLEQIKQNYPVIYDYACIVFPNKDENVSFTSLIVPDFRGRYIKGESTRDVGQKGDAQLPSSLKGSFGVAGNMNEYHAESGSFRFANSSEVATRCNGSCGGGSNGKGSDPGKAWTFDPSLVFKSGPTLEVDNYSVFFYIKVMY